MKLTGTNTAALFVLYAVAITANATIISGDVTSGNGTFIKLGIPFTESDPDNTVGNDTFQNPNLYGFDEGQNIVISVDLDVDNIADGFGGGIGAGILPSGTVVASHYVFFDPAGSSSQEGFVTFDSDVLAIVSSTGNLAASDFLINTGVNYLNPSARGLEAGDVVSIAGLQRVNVDWTASTPGDFIRVLTKFSPSADVPEPSVFALASVGLACFGFARKCRPDIR